MGGKGGGSGSSGSTTVNSTSSPPPAVLQAYQNVVGQAQGVAGTPLSQYTGPMISGFTPDQLQSFQTINNAQGVADPYINAAAQYAGQSATPISPTQFSGSQVQQYENPFTQDVINTSLANINEQNAEQQQQVVGNSIQQGAFGGDRQAIAQSELARQQALASNQTIAGLENQNYSQALGEFNTQQQVGVGAQEATGWLGSNAGYALGNLGNEAENTTLTGANAQLQSGALQQQLAQEQLNIPYEMFLQQQAYPFQTTNFLAGVTEGVGGLEGGTSSTTSPGASTGSQIAGLGIAGLGAAGASGAFSNLFSAGAAAAQRGGRIERADGGWINGTGIPGFDNSDVQDVNQLMALAGDSPVVSLSPGSAGLGPPGAPAPNALAGFGTDSTTSSSAGGSSSSGGGWGGALQGGAEGAAIGTEIFPGWGTAIGAVGGALVGGLSNRGGRVPRASGGVSGYSLPGIPDVSVSYVPESAPTSHGSALPGAPQPYASQSPITQDMSGLQAGIAYGKLFKNGAGTTNPNNPFLNSNSPTPNGAVLGGSEAANESALLGNASLDAYGPAWNSRGGRVGRAAGGGAGATSPLIAGFTTSPSGVSIPVLSMPGSGSGAVNAGTSGFAVPTAPIGTNIANANPAPAGQLDIAPTFNWSPPDPNSLSSAVVKSTIPVTPPPPSPAAVAAAAAAAANQASSDGGGGGNHSDNGATGLGGAGSNPGDSGIGAGSQGTAGGPGSPGAPGGEGHGSDPTGGGSPDGGPGADKYGGVIRVRRDMGGDISAAGSLGAGQPIGGGNPLYQQQLQNFAQLPTEKLFELSQRVPPTSAQGAVIQRALQQRKMNPGTAPQAQQSGFGQAPQPAQAPSPYGSSALTGTGMARGGMPGFANGGPLAHELFYANEDRSWPTLDKSSRFAMGDRMVSNPSAMTSDQNERDDRHLPSDFRQRRAFTGTGNQLLPETPSMARGGIAGYDDGGDVEPPTQMNELHGMSDADLIAAEGNPKYSSSLWQREVASRDLHSPLYSAVRGAISGHETSGFAPGDKYVPAPEFDPAGSDVAAGTAAAQATQRLAGQVAGYVHGLQPRGGATPPSEMRTRDAEASSPTGLALPPQSESRYGQGAGADAQFIPTPDTERSRAGMFAGMTPQTQPDQADRFDRVDPRGGDPASTVDVASSGARSPALSDREDTPPRQMPGSPLPPPSSPSPQRQFVPAASPDVVRPTPKPEPTAGFAQPPGGAGRLPEGSPNAPHGTPAASGPPSPPAGLQPAPPPAAAAKQGDWSQSPWLALVNAGAAMAAGRSPHALQNAGEGILAGTKTLTEQAAARREQQKVDQTAEFQKAEIAARNRGYDVEAAHFKQLADESAARLQEEHAWHGTEADLRNKEIARQKASDEMRQQHDFALAQKYADMASKGNYEPVAPITKDGKPVIDPDTGATMWSWVDKSHPGRVEKAPYDPSALAKTGERQGIITNLMHENNAEHEKDPSVPLLTYREALALSQRSPNASAEELGRERLAMQRAKSLHGDGSYSDAELETARKQFGLKPFGQGQTSAAPANQAAPPTQATYNGQTYGVLRDANGNHAIKIGDKYVPVTLQNGVWTPSP